MKKILLTLLLSAGLTGCSSFELEGVPTPDTETQKILSLGLTHDENLSAAQNLTGAHMIAVVTGKLNQVEDKKNKDMMDAINIAKYSENVKVLESDSEIKFEGSKISNSKRVGILDEFDYQDYFLKGNKDKNSGLIEHHLHLIVNYTWKKQRNYSSASFCDKWQGCENEEKIAINLMSSSASNCTPSACDYSEIMELSLTDDFLRNNTEEDFSISFNSDKATNKITLTTDYVRGYLKVAN